MPENTVFEQGARFREIIGVLHKHEIIKGLSPEKVRKIIEDLGPTYIKLGQIMSMHSDILPSEYCKELEKLRSNVAPMPFEQVVHILETAYGQPVSDVFEKIEEHSLGAASIAQAHKAVLKSGEEIVVKVLREGVYDTMSKDIALLHRGTKLMRYNSSLEAVDFDKVLDEMWIVAQEEMNFLMEAANIEEFGKLNKDIAYVSYPKLYRNYTTSQVLVMEYIGGDGVDKKKALVRDGYDLEEIGTKLADNYMKQILEDGFFHADPHPGNIRIRDGKIVWIDMGMMGRLTNHDRMLLDDIIAGIAEKDSNQIKDALISLGDIKGRIDHHRLYMDIDDIITKYVTSELGGINLSAVMDDFFEAMSRNKIGIPSNLTMLVRGLATIEGVVADVAPEIDVLSVAASRMKQRMMQQFDLKKELKRNGKTIFRSLRKAIDIPGVTSDLLHMFMKGQTRLNLDLHATTDLSRMLNNLVRDIVLGLLVSALLISSSLICMTDMKPKLLGIPALGCVGYMAAIVLAIWLFWQHSRSRKQEL